MNFEPQKFFVGVIDFFSVLLPGATLTYFFMGKVGSQVLVGRYGHMSDNEAALVFLFASYLLGHFLFLIGSLLDANVYEKIREATKQESPKESLRRFTVTGPRLSPIPPRIRRWLARQCFGNNPDAALDRVVLLKEGYLERIQAPQTINAYQWSKARLTLLHPEALSVVNRFEADSKFFRSFIPVLVILLGSEIVRPQHHWSLLAMYIVFLALAFWRYAEQRFKSTQQAYTFILTLEAEKESHPL